MNVTEVHVGLVINDKAIPTYQGFDDTSKFIQFYPSTRFFLRLVLPSNFVFLADTLLLTISINGDLTKTVHLRANEEGQVVEGVIRSPVLLFHSEPHDHGQIVAKLSHAKRAQSTEPGNLTGLSAQSEMNADKVVNASSPSTDALDVIPLAYPEQQTITFNWNFRSLDALREVVPGARLRSGPVWTEADEMYHQRQMGSAGAEGGEQDQYMLSRYHASDEDEDSGAD